MVSLSGFCTYSDGENPQYNGNVSSISWASENFPEIKQYTFSYDDIDRLISADFSNSNGFSLNIGGYDKNGNILSLSRYGKISDETFSLIDNLTYSYSGNQLKNVNDNVGVDYQNNGFSDNGSFNSVEYFFDQNGNLVKDLNKQIEHIYYNHMNLPELISISSGQQECILYLYDASGRKVQKQTRVNQAITSTIDYVNNFIYDNDILDYIITPEGRIINGDEGFYYEYYLKDHLGNSRVVFNEFGDIAQDCSYYPFGMKISGLYWESFSVSSNKYLYNGKEFQDDFDLDWYDYGARFYDPQLGRWHVVDPLADKYPSIAPYAYVANNPLNCVDLEGKKIVFVVTNSDGKVITSLTYRNGNFWHQNGSRYNPGRESLSKDLYITLSIYRNILKSGDPVLINQLKTLESSDKMHYLYGQTKSGEGSYVSSYEKGKTNSEEKQMKKDGVPLGSQTVFDYSQEAKDYFKNVEGVEDTDLYIVVHEMRHQFDLDQGKSKDDVYPNSAEDPSEIRAVDNENRVRKKEEKRTTYGGEKINPTKIEQQ